MNQTTPRERRYQRTQQAILDAARKIISEQGITALSIRAIAEQIDYSPASLYEYYGSKEEIIQALCVEAFHRFAIALNAVDVSLPDPDYLHQIGLAYLRFAMENPDLFLLMFTTAPLSYREETTMTQVDASKEMEDKGTFGILLIAVQRCIDAKLLQVRPKYGLLEMATAAWSLVHGFAMLRLTVLQPMPIDEETIREILRPMTQDPIIQKK